MKFIVCGLLVVMSIASTRCGQRVPRNVSQAEGDQVLKLTPEKQIDAYLARIHETKPPNYALAFVIAPNVDVPGTLATRISRENSDQTLVDLIFLARVACNQRGDCSHDGKLIAQLQAACDRIHDQILRDRARDDVRTIEHTG